MSRSKKKKKKEIYFNRERKLNQMINKFTRLTFRGNLNDLDSYDAMNRMRLEIKRIFDIQSEELHNQSRRRRYIYYEQLSRFKSIYCHWKTVSFPAFITRVFNLPEHLIHSLEWYYAGIKKGYVVSYSIF